MITSTAKPGAKSRGFSCAPNRHVTGAGFIVSKERAATKSRTYATLTKKSATTVHGHDDVERRGADDRIAVAREPLVAEHVDGDFPAHGYNMTAAALSFLPR
jgi:hypothetical protein